MRTRAATVEAEWCLLSSCRESVRLVVIACFGHFARILQAQPQVLLQVVDKKVFEESEV